MKRFAKRTLKIIVFLFHFQTAFVRQKTPHPKELKAKAHKLFGNKKPLENQGSLDNNENNHNGDHHGVPMSAEDIQSQPQTFFNENVVAAGDGLPVMEQPQNNGGGHHLVGVVPDDVGHVPEEEEEDEEEVSLVCLIVGTDFYSFLLVVFAFLRFCFEKLLKVGKKKAKKTQSY